MLQLDNKTKNLSSSFLQVKVFKILYNANSNKLHCIPYCRGSKPDPGVFVTNNNNTQSDTALYVHDEVGQPSSVSKISTKSDILICYATVKGEKYKLNVLLLKWI